MAEHGVDGAFLQRFVGQCDLEAGSEGIRRIRDEVGDRVMEAAEKEGRAFAIMYDVSGVPSDRIQKIIERDWVHLIRNQGILDSPNYLRERGKPVVALWGFGFENAGHTPALVREVTKYIRNVTPGGAYIMAGTPAHWRTAESDADRNPEFLDVWLNEFDAISPWTVGRYRNEQDADDFAETKMKRDTELIKKRNDEGRWRKIDYIPVVLPGGSGFNLSQGKWGFNAIKRDGGRFLWKQIFNAKRHGARTMYGAMWDEYDEGTAFMPVVEKKRMLPVSDKHPFLSLDEDGYDLPSDWYMRICGFAAEGLRSERRIFESFPSKELQDYWASRPKYEDVDHTSGNFVSGTSKGTGDDVSGGGEGQSYQSWLDAQKEDKEELPPPPYSLEEASTETAATSSAASVSGAVWATPATSHTTPVLVPDPVVSDPRTSSPSTTSTAAIETASDNHPPSGSIRQPTGPPPVNAGSRPHQHDPSLSASSSTHGRISSTPDATNAHPTHTHNNTPSNNNSMKPVGATAHDSVAALANDFGRHGLGSSDSSHASSPPPLVQASRPTVVQISKPNSSERPQSQAGHTQSGSPASGSSTLNPAPQSGGSWSQGQWPPTEWGINNDPRHQLPTLNQSIYPDQISGGANLSRPQTLSTTSHYPAPSLSPPHSAMNTRPPYSTSSPIPSHAAGAPYGATPSTYAPPSGASPFHGPNTSTYMPGGSAFPHSGPSFPPALPGGLPYSPSSAYPGQIGSSAYPSGYPPSAPHVPGFGGSPHASPPHSPGPGGSYYQGQTPPHGFPVAQGSSYPGQSSYGGGPPPVHLPYGAPHGIGYPPNDTPLQGGGFHMPHAPSGDNHFNGSQPQSSGYSPSYISGSASYAPTTMPATSSWYPGSSGTSGPPPAHPGRGTDSIAILEHPKPWPVVSNSISGAPRWCFEYR
ncbi:hypothetical protein C0991_009511 [Blastosporella zonata]|nr:hypothetical protein C0991_009511 [Blastosporella zonata]